MTIFDLAEWIYDQCPAMLFNEAYSLAERMAEQYPEILASQVRHAPEPITQ